MKKRLLIFSDNYSFGGSERLMAFLAKNEVVAGRFDITYAFRNHRLYRKGMEEDFKGKQIPLTLLSNDSVFNQINCFISSPFLRILAKIPLYLLYRTGLYSFFNLFVLFWLLFKTKPDVLHINNGGFPAARTCNLLALASNFFKIKKVVHQVNNQARSSFIMGQIRNFLVDKSVDTFITASKLAKHNLAIKAKINPIKISLFRNISEQKTIELSKSAILEQFGLPKDAFLLIQVGFLTKRKGQIISLKAVKRLLTTYKNIYLIFVGEGEDKKMLEKYCNSHRLAHHVFFAGHRSDANSFINAADILLFPSIGFEDMPLVIIEALQLGKCIISTDFSGIAEIVKNEYSGILLNLNSTRLDQDLADQILRIYHDSDKRFFLEHHAKLESKKFSSKKRGLKLLDIYAE